MRVKISFASEEQRDKMKEELLKNHATECEVEKLTEKMMQLQIQPNMFREINNIVKNEKAFYSEVSIEIQD